MEGLKNPIDLTTASSVDDLKSMITKMDMVKYSDGFVSAQEINKRIDVVFSSGNIISWEEGAKEDVLRVFTRNHELRATVEKLLDEKSSKTLSENNAVMRKVLKTAQDVMNSIE